MDPLSTTSGSCTSKKVVNPNAITNSQETSKMPIFVAIIPAHRLRSCGFVAVSYTHLTLPTIYSV